MPATPKNDPTAEFGTTLISETKRRLLVESAPRILRCLSQLTQEEIWFRPNDQTVSVGNLILHLCGNVRQWIVSGLGGAPDERRRHEEFAEMGPLQTDELIETLTKTMKDVRETLDRLDPASLLTPRRIQGFDVTGVSALLHVVEHCSYHTGQISYYVKSRKGVDLQYYGGQDLNARNQ